MQWFERAGERTALRLPFDVDELIRAWSGMQAVMVKQRPDAFTRNEWAYLIGAIDARVLRGVFASAFGAPAAAEGKPHRIARPRGLVAVWLPNNVSLLGPLTLILLTLTGNRIRMKTGSRAGDLTAAFVQFLLAQQVPGALRLVLARVRVEQFDRADPRSGEMAAEAQVRIVFGSDAAAAEIDRLPHPIGSVQYSFSDRASEAWIEEAAATDDVLLKLIRVFAIYGRAGCTSPRRVVAIGGNAETIAERMIALWTRAIGADIAMHLASQNVMASQWARALGWETRLAPRNAAGVATGGGRDVPDAHLVLPVVEASLDEAVAALPSNIQTLGYACSDATFAEWLPRLAATPVKRIVPVEAMHHFGPLWDGAEFWRGCFEEVEVRA